MPRSVVLHKAILDTDDDPHHGHIVNGSQKALEISNFLQSKHLFAGHVIAELILEFRDPVDNW